MALALRQAYTTYPGNAQSGVVVVAGDLIIVGYSANASTSGATISDNAAGGTNTYDSSSIAEVHNSSASIGSGRTFFAIAKNSETLTITVTSITDAGIHVHVVSGANTTLAAVLDTQSSLAGSSSGSTLTGSNFTTGNANDYLWSFWFQEDATATVTDSQSFTKEKENSSHYSGSFDQIVSATNTYHDAGTATGSGYWSNISAAFKAAAASTDPVGMICI